MRLPLPQFATKERHPDRIAEVIETATSEFLLNVWNLKT